MWYHGISNQEYKGFGYTWIASGSVQYACDQALKRKSSEWQLQFNLVKLNATRDNRKTKLVSHLTSMPDIINEYDQRCSVLFCTVVHRIFQLDVLYCICIIMCLWQWHQQEQKGKITKALDGKYINKQYFWQKFHPSHLLNFIQLTKGRRTKQHSSSREGKKK